MNPAAASVAKGRLADRLTELLTIATSGASERDLEMIRFCSDLVAAYVEVVPEYFVRCLVDTGGLELLREMHSFPSHVPEEPCLPTCRAEFRGPPPGWAAAPTRSED